MGIKREREKIFKYRNIYNSLNFFYGKNIFKFTGKINSWDEIEIICRVFYKKLEELLYSKEVIGYLYENSLKKILRQNNLLDKTLYDVIKEKKFHIESINLLIIKIFDYIYFNVKKNLPYIKNLSQISNALSEILENTYKYSSGEFAITVGYIKKGDYPLILKVENKYNYKDEKVKKNLEILKDNIEELNNISDPKEAFLMAAKKRINDLNEDAKNSRLGFAKIRLDTNAKIKLELNSKYFGEEGITLTFAIPLSVYSNNEILEKVKVLINK